MYHFYVIFILILHHDANTIMNTKRNIYKDAEHPFRPIYKNHWQSLRRVRVH